MDTSPLRRIIRTEIDHRGAIPFARFMELCLYHPDHGYYMSDRPRIGPEGDFYTACHLHPLFGRMVAVQLEEMAHLLATPAPFTIVEVGAGRGFLAEGILAYLMETHPCTGSFRYHIVERNPAAIVDQKRRLAPFGNRVVWNNSLSDVGPFSGCVLSNELLDAFPVHLLSANGRYHEIHLENDKDGFRETFSPPGGKLAEYIERYALPARDGYRTEANLAIGDYLGQIDRVMDKGFILSIDYGYSARQYYAPERRCGTLCCFRRHRVSETPYAHPGGQDITAHVNFSHLRDAGLLLGFAPAGYCAQGAFLVSLGIHDHVEAALNSDPLFPLEIPKIKSLLFDMGESHKVMIQYRGTRKFHRLTGFSISDRLHTL